VYWQWILINAEIFEVAYREHHDMEAERYIDLKKIWKYDIVK